MEPFQNSRRGVAVSVHSYSGFVIAGFAGLAKLVRPPPARVYSLVPGGHAPPCFEPKVFQEKELGGGDLPKFLILKEQPPECLHSEGVIHFRSAQAGRGLPFWNPLLLCANARNNLQQTVNK